MRSRTEPRPDGELFVRDRVTTMSYAVFGAYAFYLYAAGPATALLRSELLFSYTVTSISSGLWAGAAILAGLSFPRIARHVARRSLLWWAAFGMAAASVLLAVSGNIGSALASFALLSFTGTTALMAIQATLADHHGPRRDRALVEANVGASLCAVTAPLALGLLDDTAVGWRAGMVLPVPVLFVLYLRYRREQPPAAPRHPVAGERSGRLPRIYWLRAPLVAGSMALEMCLVFFAAELLVTTTGVNISTAAATVVSFLLGMLVGRIGGGIIARRPGRSVRLLWASLALTLAGVLLCWLSGQLLLAALGLFIAGVGAANMYPLSLALALAAAPGNSDAANARTQLLGGSLAIAAPLLLGTLADRVGVTAAFAVEPGLIVLSALLLLIGQAAAGKSQPSSDLRGGLT